MLKARLMRLAASNINIADTDKDLDLDYMEKLRIPQDGGDRCSAALFQGKWI